LDTPSSLRETALRLVRRLQQAGHKAFWVGGCVRDFLLGREPVELVGFELLLPALVERARAAGVAVPPHLDVYAAQRARKLDLIPATALYSPRATVVHSLEFLGGEADPLRLNDLAARIGSSAPTASRAVDALDELGLVTRTTDADDRRAVRIELTEAGRRLVDERKARAATAFEPAVTALPAADREQLLRLLARLTDALS